MNVFQRVAKAFQMRFGGMGGMGGMTSFLMLGRTRYNYAKDVGDGTGSSIVMAVVNWVARTFPEAPAQVAKYNPDGTRDVLRAHALTQLLRRPNPFYSGVLLWMAMLIDLLTLGNGYWIKLRNKQRRVVQLWWAPARTMEPRWNPDGSEYIGWYEYSPGGIPIRLEVSEVVHFRLGLDPYNTRKGLSPLTTLLREIFTDDEAANFSASMLRNLGVPGVILSPDDDQVDVSTGDMEKMKANFKASFSGDQRGEPMVLGARMKAQMLGYNPQQMDLKALRRVPEERISAVFGVPAIVAGLGAGLDKATFANFAEAREAAYESNIIPLQRMLAADLDRQLLPDFEAGNEFEMFFDTSGVRVLQEDENDLAKRIQTLVAAGVMKRSEARSKLGLEVKPEDDVYYLSSWIIETGDGAREPTLIDAAAAPAPEGGEKGPEGDGEKGLKADPPSQRRQPPTATQKWRARMEGRIKKAVTAYLDEQYERAAQSVEGAKEMGLEGLDTDGTELQSLFAEFQRLLVRRAYKDADETLEVGLGFDVENTYVQQVLGELGRLIRADIPETTVREIRALLGQQAAEGWSADDLAVRIRALKEMSPVRAKLIAVTETARGYSMGSRAAYKESGVVDEMEWLVFEPCEVCQKNHGKRVGLNGGTFPTGHELPPAHPGCRCAVAPIVKE